jgi:hypothetical protein
MCYGCYLGSLLTSYRIRADIRGGAIDISDNYFITCLYPKDSGDPGDVEKHYLRGMLLVKACGYCHGSFYFPSLTLLQTYCAIFTSPSSSEAFEEEMEDGPCRKKQKNTTHKKATKSNVATLLRMEGKVTPRTIAYAAVLVSSTNTLVFPVSPKQLQLVFNLMSATQWTEEC